MLKNRIVEDLKKALEKLNFPPIDIVCTIPKNTAFGDYSTNLALQLAKLDNTKGKQPASTSDKHFKSKRGENPIEIANKIVDRLLVTGDSKDYLKKVESKGSGFINFFIKPEILAIDLMEILEKKENFGKSSIGKNKKVRVEYVSANPTGPLHIGNARGGPIGDVVANVFESLGYEVLREYIHNDVGGQVNALGLTIKAKIQNKTTEENQYKGEYIAELAEKVGDIEGKTDEEIGKSAVDVLYKEIMEDVSKMGIKFNLVVNESDFKKNAEEVILQLQKAGVVKEKDGALWLAPDDEFLKDRETVIKKSDGSYTYFTSDIVYHKMKFESGAELVIDIFGSNHHGHVPRLQAAVSALGFDASKLKVILYQYVRVKRGEDVIKMSKRAGNFITAREVLDEVGKDAFRFYLLRFSPQTHIDFDLELVKEQSSKNPVFYVQYAHARMSNLLLKSEEVGEEIDLSLLVDPKELNLIKHLTSYPDLVKEIALSLQVHQLTEYAIILADYFHKFYETCPVLNAKNKDLVNARLALVKASKITIANVLSLIGVSAPERM